MIYQLPVLVLLCLSVSACAPSAPEIGIDVSHHSGDIEWSRVLEQDVAFVYLKATEGVDDADPRFADHLSQLRSLGVPRGAYHFYVTEDDPEKQARFFLSRYVPKTGDLAPVVDIELLGHGTTGDLGPRLRRFLEIVEEEVGVPPVIYTGPNFWNAHFDDSFGRHPLWVAEYGVTEPKLPKGWTRWTLWQDRGNVEVPGVEKGADLSRLHPEINLNALRIPETKSGDA